MAKIPFACAVFAGLLGCSSIDSEGRTPFGGGPSGDCSEATAAPNIGAWDATAASFEQRVLELVNEQRSHGGCCGSEGCFEPSPALALSQNLQAAARLQARDMVQRNFFSHTNPDGETYADRAEAAGFGGCALAENIAQGQDTPEAVMQSWMESSGHCSNILSDWFTSLGVGYFDDETAELRHAWVMDFGG